MSTTGPISRILELLLVEKIDLLGLRKVNKPFLLEEEIINQKTSCDHPFSEFGNKELLL